jgi:hypothetical protein
MGSPQLQLIWGGLCELKPIPDPTDATKFPIAFRSRNGLIETLDLLDHWPGSGSTFYKVVSIDGSILIIKHEERKNQWSINKWIVH